MKPLSTTISLLFVISLLFQSGVFVSAETRVEELKGEISQRNQEITEIEKEIEEYQDKINETVAEKKTLKNQIYQLNNTANKLRSEINLTNKKIGNTNLTIEKIGIEIEGKNNQIKTSKASLAEIIRRLDEKESQTLLEILLANNDLSDFFSAIQGMEYLQKDIVDGLDELRALKSDLESNQTEKTQEKTNLVALTSKLDDQKQIADSNKSRKNNLLKQTKNKEENYKSLLEEKQAKKEAFLQEIAELEAEIRIEIDPNSIPEMGSGVLKYPLANVSLKSCWEGGGGFKNCVTQFFGNTPFATKNPQVYGGSGHNGLDFRASVGEELYASLSGTIEGTGNTDKIPGCYSYGKWVLIKHNNGLSTLYAHMSKINVSPGQTVKTGQLIGYSGQTGYATGPHLHYTVYASQGVQITKFTKSINCKNAWVPIADKRAYLNPLSYL